MIAYSFDEDYTNQNTEFDDKMIKITNARELTGATVNMTIHLFEELDVMANVHSAIPRPLLSEALASATINPKQKGCGQRDDALLW